MGFTLIPVLHPQHAPIAIGIFFLFFRIRYCSVKTKSDDWKMLRVKTENGKAKTRRHVALLLAPAADAVLHFIRFTTAERRALHCEDE